MSLIAGNLGIIQRLLDQHRITWGIFGGAAAHLYGNRRPINNIDILVPVGNLRSVMEQMKQARRVGQFDGRRIIWSGINICDDLTVRNNSTTHTIKMDAPMIERLRRMPLLGSRVSLLAPEDVLVHKLLLGRPDKHDDADAISIAQRQTLDVAYLRERMRLCNGSDIIQQKLTEHGVVLEEG